MDNKKKVNEFDKSLFDDKVEEINKSKKMIFDFDDDLEDELLISIKPKINNDALKMFSENDDSFFEHEKISHSEQKIKNEEINSTNTTPRNVKSQYIDLNNPDLKSDSELKNIDSSDELYQELDMVKIKSVIESTFYVVGQIGVSIGDIRRLTNAPTNIIKKLIKDWATELENDSSRGILIKQFGDHYKFFSKPDNKENLHKLITIKYKNPLSSKVMETLAIIAYNQPCTKSVIEEIRLKDPTPVVYKLIELGLVIDAGRATTPGSPILYTVTPKFYDIFGIKSLSELPNINLDNAYFDEDVSFFDTTRFED